MSLIDLADGRKVVKLPGGGDLVVLDRVTFRVGHGESVAVLGRSGSGKTTLLSVIGLIEPFSSGRLLVDGADVATLSPFARARLRGRLFGFVYQRFCLLDHLTAIENVEAPLLHAGWSASRSRRRRAAEALERVGLAHRLKHRPAQLSGGEQQRVAIARAIVREPAIILADEPLGSLDVETGEAISDILFSFVRDHDTTLVLVTHDQWLAERCDRIVRIEKGAFVEE